jgi:hypothetical protein
MNAPPSDAQAKALEFVNSASSYVLLATIALLAWVASGVEFSNDGLRLASMACLTLSVVFGVATLRLFRWCRRRGGRVSRTSTSKRASCCSAGAARG